MQSSVSTFVLPANGGMEGDCWLFFPSSLKVHSGCLTAPAIRVLSILPGGKIRKPTENKVPRISQKTRDKNQREPFSLLCQLSAPSRLAGGHIPCWQASGRSRGVGLCQVTPTEDFTVQPKR